ncbi:hypothetical protein E0L93_05040 [Rubrobacter taiwanensis]|jgi:hypothetical protein|uniref:Uncharacterized protein n=1 Tax=Rubrobacter taiwanensis TaxID=185139 RepID=A0A4R1BN27_9ACTN|nr:hypothetical protein [Rubrobacter taiwanensis]TCJ18869.1 hypothetical protein E0L93_05040 [Rubrobacter taiwanensis]
MGPAIRVNYVMVALVFAVAAMLGVAAAAGAQQPAGDQYAAPAPPPGPAEESQCVVPNDTDGIVNAGDVIECEGDFAVTPGASVVLQDGDGTQGTFIDGTNANISAGSLIIEVTADPINVHGGDGVLNTEGLFVVSVTGVAPTEAQVPTTEAEAAVLPADFLPFTGGLQGILVALSSVAFVSAGLIMLRRLNRRTG